MYIGKRKLFMGIILSLVMFLSIGCQGNAEEAENEDEIVEETENDEDAVENDAEEEEETADQSDLSEEEDQDEKTNESRPLSPEEEAGIALFESRYNNDSNVEVVFDGGSFVVDGGLHFSITHYTTVNGTLFYGYEIVGTGGGAATTTYVSNKTGNVYDWLEDAINSEVNFSQLDSQVIQGKTYYRIPITEERGDLHKWDMYMVKGESRTYSAEEIETLIAEGKAEEKKEAANKNLEAQLSSDFFIKLLGEDISSVEKMTGNKAETEELVDPDSEELYEQKVINGDGYTISFSNEGYAVKIILETGKDVLGARVGMTIDEIEATLGQMHFHSYQGFPCVGYYVKDISISFFMDESNSRSNACLIDFAL